MFDLWRLQRKRRKTEDEYDAKVAKARREKDEEQIDILNNEYLAEIIYNDEAVAALLGRKLLSAAERLDIETPPMPVSPLKHNEFWDFTVSPGEPVLNVKGRTHLRKLIDEERTRRREVRMWWIKLLVPIITALAALVGAITGLVLAFRK